MPTSDGRHAQPFSVDQRAAHQVTGYVANLGKPDQTGDGGLGLLWDVGGVHMAPQAGEPDSERSRSGRTVLLLHAMGSSGRMWRAQAAALADRYRLVVPDLPGHAANTDRFTIDGAVEQARGLLNGTPAYVVGISLGAVVALKLAINDPGAVAGLMVSGATVRVPRFGAAVQRAITMTVPVSSLARMSASIVKPVDAADRTTLVSDIQRAGKRTQLDALRELSLLDLRPALDRIGVPTLVCCGSLDRANLTSARILAESIPTATLRIIPDGGHLWNLQQPSLCTEIIDEAAR